MTIAELIELENVVIESDEFIKLDCWMSYPDEK